MKHWSSLSYVPVVLCYTGLPTQCCYPVLITFVCLGYEHYNLIRSDPCLCFLSRVGLPNDMNDSTAGEPTDPDDRLVHIVLAKSETIIVVHKKRSAAFGHEEINIIGNETCLANSK